MNMTLRRIENCEEGIFGSLAGLHAGEVFATLEHSYEGKPKLLPGLYVCKRGIHHLKESHTSFETFEILNVVGHVGILFHPGNYDGDSAGCVLIGTCRVGNMITDSRAAFKRFMKLQAGVDQFNLVVT